MDSIQRRTSASYQHSRLLWGSLKGAGIRCWYLAFVAQVRIVVTRLPIKAASCSMKRIRGVPLSWAANGLGMSFTITVALSDKVATAARRRAATQIQRWRGRGGGDERPCGAEMNAST